MTAPARIPRTAAEVYAAAGPAWIQQGDIYLCPSSALAVDTDAPGARPIPDAPTIADGIGETRQVPAWRSALGSAPAAIHETRWGPVMVVSHECDLEKDWNALAGYLVKSGLSREEAAKQAHATPGLDRWVLVTPLLGIDEAVNEWPAAIRTPPRIDAMCAGLRVSYLPLPAAPQAFLPECVASLGRVATVERSFLEPSRRLVSQTDHARAVLRHKLERTFATRDASTSPELMAAKGQVIENISLVPNAGGKKAVAVAIYLKNGEVLHLEGTELKLDKQVIVPPAVASPTSE